MKFFVGAFYRKLWAEILMSLSPVLARFRRVMGVLGLSQRRDQELAKVIPIAPYLMRRRMRSGSEESPRAAAPAAVRSLSRHAERARLDGFRVRGDQRQSVAPGIPTQTHK